MDAREPRSGGDVLANGAPLRTSRGHQLINHTIL